LLNPAGRFAQRKVKLRFGFVAHHLPLMLPGGPGNAESGDQNQQRQYEKAASAHGLT